jgi:two-component system, OmpR family, aerobic respiration control sensor histidine kinase ArcB
MSDTLTQEPLFPPTPDVPDLSGRNVLVIENDADNLDMFAMFLRHCGAEVTAVATATSALESLCGRRMDAIITDVSVLKGSGICEFLARVRDMPEHKTTPVIAVTGWAPKDVVPNLKEFTAFMQKPVNLDYLAMTIRNLVAVA